MLYLEVGVILGSYFWMWCSHPTPLCMGKLRGREAQLGAARLNSHLFCTVQLANEVLWPHCLGQEEKSLYPSLL